VKINLEKWFLAFPYVKMRLKRFFLKKGVTDLFVFKWSEKALKHAFMAEWDCGSIFFSFLRCTEQTHLFH